MSDTPGKNLRPSDNRRRGGNRNRQRNRPPQREEMWENHGEEFRLPHRSRFREDERDARPSQREPSGAKPTLGQKLLRIFSFGLLGGPAKTPARPQEKKPSPKTGDRPPRGDRGPRPPRGERPAREDRPRREPRQPSAPPPADPASITSERLHVGNLSYDASESDLASLFNGIGKVQNVEIVYNPATHRSKGFGFVQFMSVNDARRAVTELHGKPFMGRNLLLGPARERPARDEQRRRRNDEDSEE